MLLSHISSVQLISMFLPEGIAGSLKACWSGEAAGVISGVGREGDTVRARPGLENSGGGLAQAKSRYSPKIFRIAMASCCTCFCLDKMSHFLIGHVICGSRPLIRPSCSLRPSPEGEILDQCPSRVEGHQRLEHMRAELDHRGPISPG